MAAKKTHFGRAGEFAALSEFLLRGYNVAIPSVDVGDDAFVINDADGTTWRVQVKTGDVSGKGGKRSATYNLSRSQLRDPKPAELFFMFMARWSDRWHYVLIRRDHLEQIRRSFERTPRSKKAGAKPKTDATAKRDALSVVFTWGSASATAWGTSFKSYFDAWPKAELPEIKAGPGATKPTASRSPRRQR